MSFFLFLFCPKLFHPKVKRNFWKKKPDPSFFSKIAFLPLQIQTKKPQNPTKFKPSVSLPSPSPSSPSSTFPPIPKPSNSSSSGSPSPSSSPPSPPSPPLVVTSLSEKATSPLPTQIRSSPKNPRNGSPVADRRPDDHPSWNPIFPIAEHKNPEPKIAKSNQPNGRSRLEVEEEKEWMDEDFDLLKKQIAKHPVGAPRRWEVIAEVFRGRHGLESMIKTAKSMAEKQPGGGGGDDFAQFLKQRNPLNK